MGETTTITLEWVCGEGIAKSFAKQAAEDGGQVKFTAPFVPEPEFVDLFGDAQFEPLTVVTVALATGLLLRYVKELVLDLKGREIAVIDLSGDSVVCTRLDVGRASKVILKAPDKSLTPFSPSEIDKIQDQLKSLLPSSGTVGGAAKSVG